MAVRNHVAAVTLSLQYLPDYTMIHGPREYRRIFSQWSCELTDFVVAVIQVRTRACQSLDRIINLRFSCWLGCLFIRLGLLCW